MKDLIISLFDLNAGPDYIGFGLLGIQWGAEPAPAYLLFVGIHKGTWFVDVCWRPVLPK